MKVLLPLSDKIQFAESIANALYDAFRNLKLSEPQLVANLVCELPKHLNSIHLSGTTKIKAGGVFVHARPFVTCDSFPELKPKSVEIGDLLLIRTLVVSGKVEERRALLLQAKKQIVFRQHLIIRINGISMKNGHDSHMLQGQVA